MTIEFAAMEQIVSDTADINKQIIRRVAGACGGVSPLKDTTGNKLLHWRLIKKEQDGLANFARRRAAQGGLHSKSKLLPICFSCTISVVVPASLQCVFHTRENLKKLNGCFMKVGVARHDHLTK